MTTNEATLPAYALGWAQPLAAALQQAFAIAGDDAERASVLRIISAFGGMLNIDTKPLQSHAGEGEPDWADPGPEWVSNLGNAIDAVVAANSPGGITDASALAMRSGFEGLLDLRRMRSRNVRA